MTLTRCAICNGEQDMMREHCKYCGARRIFQCSHSYEPYCVVVKAQHEGKEIVRAYRSDYAYNFVTAR